MPTTFWNYKSRIQGLSQYKSKGKSQYQRWPRGQQLGNVQENTRFSRNYEINRVITIEVKKECKVSGVHVL